MDERLRMDLKKEHHIGVLQNVKTNKERKVNWCIGVLVYWWSRWVLHGTLAVLVQIGTISLEQQRTNGGIVAVVGDFIVAHQNKR